MLLPGAAWAFLLLAFVQLALCAEDYYKVHFLSRSMLILVF